MIFLIGSGIVTVFAILCYARYYAKKDRYNNWDDKGNSFFHLAVFFVLIAFVVSGLEWSSQILDFEKIKMHQKVEAIYEAKADKLTTEFAKYLAEAYPEYEKDIYNQISPDKVNMYFVKYPELKTSVTLVELVKSINNLQSDVYDQRIKVEQIRKDIRFRLQNPWLFSFMIPRNSK